jgi:hypothetical protein
MNAPEPPVDPEIASIKRRLAAAAIDAAVLLPGIGVLIAAGVKLYAMYLTRTGLPKPSDETHREARAKRIKRLSWISSPFVTVCIRNWRTPGARATGTRRVDARSGGRVTVRSGLIAAGVEVAWGRLSSHIYRPINRRRDKRMEAFRAEIKAIQEQYPDEDSPGRENRLQTRGRAEGASCLRWLLWQLPPMFGRQLPALWSQRNQTLTERLAGVVTIVDR